MFLNLLKFKTFYWQSFFANDLRVEWYFLQSGIISNKIVVVNNGNFETEAQNLAMKLRKKFACVRTF